MGLFGGFRAKFTRNSKSKETTTNEVVCLKYLVHSEFDPVNTSNGFVPIRPALRKNSFAQPDKKQKRYQIKSQIVFENKEPSPKLIKKSKSLTNIEDIPPPPPKTPPPKLTKEPFEDETLTNILTNSSVSPSDRNVAFQFKEEIKPEKNGYLKTSDEPSTLILMTQHSAEPSPSFRFVEDTFSFVQGTSSPKVEFPQEHSPSFQTTEETFSFVRGTTSGSSPMVEFPQEQSPENETFSFVQRATGRSPKVEFPQERNESFKITEETFSFEQETTSGRSPTVEFPQEQSSGNETFSFVQRTTGRSPKVEFPQEQETFSFPREQTSNDKSLDFFPQEYSDASTLEADDFHINVVDYSNRKYSMSEDEVSNDDLMEEYEEGDSMEFSSQASSIFFGNDMRPVPARRRMLTLKDEEGNRRRISEEDVDC